MKRIGLTGIYAVDIESYRGIGCNISLDNELWVKDTGAAIFSLCSSGEGITRNAGDNARTSSFYHSSGRRRVSIYG